MTDYLDFERPLAELEEKIERLKGMAADQPKSQEEIQKLHKRAQQLRRDIYGRLTPLQTLQIARHANRPSTLDYLGHLIPDFVELHGDRLFADDSAIVGGVGRLDGSPVVVIGHQKGRNVRERVKRNFGMPHPEGYRKAQRLMRMAERFKRPVITFIDTPGAYPGVGAEERGQSEAIASSLRLMAELGTPIIAIVIGEGGSGGALALGVADRILMLEYSVYSVISPEGCAAILWKSPDKTAEAADALKMTAKDLLALGVVDQIISEPPGCAHRDPAAAAASIKQAIAKHLAELADRTAEELISARYDKFRKMGVVQ
ncbi:MAG TPA: acetyl-CoA carboxylase carboxyltransferase subunit alpha [Nitrospiria bacterium]|nr:acetyl-CoA carboxylase carboxyltransferase subunit alpha [Nitrospiria bacterium]